MRIPYVSRALERVPTWFLTTYAMLLAFGTYFCMYAFRKPFSAASYEGPTFFGTEIQMKTALVISQIIGYCLSKWIGIKVVSEMPRRMRPVALIGFVLIAWAALLLFAVLPTQLMFIAIFINGLPLGMVWGLVVWYLEGRRTSELLLAGLSCAYIIASGIVKDVGRALMGGLETLPVFAIDVGLQNPVQLRVPNVLQSFGAIPETWMPFATGAVFIVPFLLFVFLLNHMPEPTEEDVEARTRRKTMDGQDRWAFFRAFMPGMILLCVSYFMLTAYRDFRDNYGIEIFDALGYQEEPAIFARSEVWVAFGIMVVLAGIVLVRNNRWGLMTVFAVLTIGMGVMAGSTMLLEAGTISGLTWMSLVGFGAYLAYVPYGSVLFDRMIASTHVAATAVFAIYLTDAIGYTGSVFTQLFKDLIFGDVSRLAFFKGFTYTMAGTGAVMYFLCGVYFLHKTSRGQIELTRAAVTGDGDAAEPVTGGSA